MSFESLEKSCPKFSFENLEQLFNTFLNCQALYSLGIEELDDLIPVWLFEPSYYRFKEPEVRKNMLNIISMIIKKTIVVFMGKCMCCKDSSFYTHKNKYYCYKHAPKNSTKLMIAAPFEIYEGKHVKDYDSCMDVFIYYSEKARNINYPVYEIEYYRNFANLYLCLATYMHDAPAGVYPRNSDITDMFVINKPPEIVQNPKYKKFIVRTKQIDTRVTDKILYKKKK